MLKYGEKSHPKNLLFVVDGGSVAFMLLFFTQEYTLHMRSAQQKIPRKLKEYFVRLTSFFLGRWKIMSQKCKNTHPRFWYIHCNDLKLLMKSQSFAVSQHIKMPPGLLSMAAGLDIFGSCLCPSGFFWNPALNPRVFRCSSTKRPFT